MGGEGDGDLHKDPGFFLRVKVSESCLEVPRWHGRSCREGGGQKGRSIGKSRKGKGLGGSGP